MFLGNLKKIGVGLCLCLAATACQSNPPQDSHVVVDDSPDGNAGDETADADQDSDSDEAETGDVRQADPDPLEFDEALWHQPNPCEGEVTYDDPDKNFEMPERPPDTDPVHDRDEVVSRLGSLPRQGFSIRPSATLEPGGGRSFQLFSEPGTDLTFHVYVINNYDDLSSFRINLLMMVDYEPVEATYERWAPDRDNQLWERRATGVNFPVEYDVEIIDVTIPAEVFDEQRMYELAISVRSTTIERRPTSDVRRYALYNGGYQRPSRPCVEPRLDQPVTDFEKYLGSRIGSTLGLLFFEGITGRNDLREEIIVEPGETRSIYLSAQRSAVQGGPRPTVMVPLMDGEPVGEPWWINQGDDSGTPAAYIDARKSFDMTFPDEPGVYEVQLATWEDPYEIARDIDGNRIGEVSEGGYINVNSNALRFRVVDD
ncbi:MAG: hypothetical protein ACLFVJ_04480 [Persicimonas sp.]